MAEHHQKIEKICPYCQKVFEVLWARRQKVYCCNNHFILDSKGKKHNYVPSTAFKKGHKYIEKEDSNKKKSAAHIKRWEKIKDSDSYKNKITKNKRYLHECWTREYKEWRKLVFERDEYMCQECSQKGGYLQAHHILDWANYPEHRYLVKNGVCLCRKCHRYVHWVEKLNQKIYEAIIGDS